jgi:hypothetical protein
VSSDSERGGGGATYQSLVACLKAWKSMYSSVISSSEGVERADLVVEDPEQPDRTIVVELKRLFRAIDGRSERALHDRIERNLEQAGFLIRRETRLQGAARGAARDVVRGYRFHFGRPARPKRINIQAPPGQTLHRIASFVFSKRTFSRVLEPVLADMQLEYIEALAAGERLRGGWIRLRGYLAFSVAVTFKTGVGRFTRLLWKILMPFGVEPLHDEEWERRAP